MLQHEQVELLLTQAAQDEKVLDNAPVEIFGFHAQQVAEKLLKAVLVAAGTTSSQTHQLAELIDLVSDSGWKFQKPFRVSDT